MKPELMTILNSAPTEPLILIVDDDPDIRVMLTDLLEEEGHHVVSVPNGLEALQYLRSTNTSPALILLDLMMPIMNGWQFRAEQKQDPALASIPVVIITADNSALQQPDLSDAAGYLLKPLQFHTLLTIANQYTAPGIAANSQG
jgi:CheY-like chemotaxis protein